jgi:hypothetical protein
VELTTSGEFEAWVTEIGFVDFRAIQVFLYGSDNPEGGSTDYCSRLINGEITITAERPAGCSDKPDVPLVCSPLAPGIRRKKRAVRIQE